MPIMRVEDGARVRLQEREGLITRIRQLRRVAAPPPKREQGSPPQAYAEELRRLAERVAHLEALLQGLQDSVHRESVRHGDRIAELEARIDPAAISRTLSEDARTRGL